MAWRRVSPLAVIDMAASSIRKGAAQALPGLLVLFASAASSDRVELLWVIQGLVALAVIGVGWAILSYFRFGYREREALLEIRKGVLHRQVLNVDFDRIQNVSVHEPFYFRPFGQAVVSVDTAGSSGREIRLAGLELEAARALRARLVAGHRAETASAVSDREAAAADEDEILLQLTRRDVVIAGLTTNFMLWAAVAIGTVFGSGDTAENSIEWLIARFNLGEVFNAIRADGGDLMLGLVTAGFVLAAMALLPLISVIGALFRYDGYTLSTDGDRFRRSSGLLSRHDDSVRQHKIQAVTWRQNAIALGFRRINVQLRQASAGEGAEAQPGMNVRSAFTVPSLRPDEAQALTARFLPGFSPMQSQFTGVDRRRYLVMVSALPLLILLTPVLSLALALSGWLLLAYPLFAAVTVLIVHRCWRQTGWALDGDHALLRKGFIGSTTSVFPLHKVQRVDVVQTPSQRRRGLAHLTVHLASHSLTMPWMRAEDAERLRDLALYRAESSDKAWF